MFGNGLWRQQFQRFSLSRCINIHWIGGSMDWCLLGHFRCDSWLSGTMGAGTQPWLGRPRRKRSWKGLRPCEITTYRVVRLWQGEEREKERCDIESHEASSSTCIHSVPHTVYPQELQPWHVTGEDWPHTLQRLSCKQLNSLPLAPCLVGCMKFTKATTSCRKCCAVKAFDWRERIGNISILVWVSCREKQTQLQPPIQQYNWFDFDLANWSINTYITNRNVIHRILVHQQMPVNKFEYIVEL